MDKTFSILIVIVTIYRAAESHGLSRQSEIVKYQPVSSEYAKLPKAAAQFSPMTIANLFMQNTGLLGKIGNLATGVFKSLTESRGGMYSPASKFLQYNTKPDNHTLKEHEICADSDIHCSSYGYVQDLYQNTFLQALANYKERTVDVFSTDSRKTSLFNSKGAANVGLALNSHDKRARLGHVALNSIQLKLATELLLEQRFARLQSRDNHEDLEHSIDNLTYAQASTQAPVLVIILFWAAKSLYEYLASCKCKRIQDPNGASNSRSRSQQEDVEAGFAEEIVPMRSMSSRMTRQEHLDQMALEMDALPNRRIALPAPPPLIIRNKYRQ